MAAFFKVSLFKHALARIAVRMVVASLVAINLIPASADTGIISNAEGLLRDFALVPSIGFTVFETIENEPNWVKTSPSARVASSQTREELSTALIGDSLSLDFSLSSVPETIAAMRYHHQGGWFMDIRPGPHSARSLVKRLGKHRPVYAHNFSTVGSRLNGPIFELHELSHQVGRVHSFSEQVDLWAQQSPLPDLNLLWIGHNNTDWMGFPNIAKYSAGPEQERVLQEAVIQFKAAYRLQLERMIHLATSENHRRAFVVFGLINFRSFFKARDEALRLKENHPKRYPYATSADQAFVSMVPKYREILIRLADQYNASLKELVSELQPTLAPWIRLDYSGAMASADLSNITLLQKGDAWHPSSAGQTRLAQSAYGDLRPVIQFLDNLDRP